MNSDTIIGIVGAVILVSVMIGVFAYEYNNAPEVSESSAAEMEAAKKASFNSTFLGMDAMGDIDGDGRPNYNDTDVDGDGLNNTMDDETKIHSDVGGSLAQGQGQSNTVTLPAEAGIMHIMLEVRHAATVAGQTLGSLDVVLTSPSGDSYTASAVAEGDDLVYQYDLTLDVEAGDYTVLIQHTAQGGVLQVGPAVTYTGQLVFHYPTPVSA